MQTPSFLKRLMVSVNPSESTRVGRKTKKAIELCRTLMSERGEVSGAALAREALAAYDSLSEAETEPFFELLATDFSPDPRQVLRAADRYRDRPSQENLSALQRAVEPPRQELFRRLNMAPGGTATLVAMRQRVRRGLKSHPEWTHIDTDMAHLFTSWFNRGFLTIERIDWHTAAIVLEKLVRHEAVHQVRSWRDLRRRLEADRRCFAFFHPALPGEPIIFIEVALTKGISTSVKPLLDLSSPVLDPESADSAIFYSITSCQQGLRGIPFGNLLIKQVVQQIGREFPRITNFATLSPVPGFRAWVAALGDSLDAIAAGREMTETLKRLRGDDWLKRGDLAALQPILMSLCAYYLLHAKQGAEPADPVARFHLGNGAQLDRINWLADVSKRGLQRSAGLMVNYLYDLGDVEANRESYVSEHRVVASRQLKRLARDCPLLRRQESAAGTPRQPMELSQRAS